MSTSPRKPQPEQSELFPCDDGGDASSPPTVSAGGRPRVRAANREQIVFHASALDDLIPADHAVRLVWDYVKGLDLAVAYARIKSVEGGPGRAAIDPKILMALWLYATIEGVGSARQLDRLCREHVAYQWIVGDVSTNYHTLADFRTDQVEVLDALLTTSVAALVTEGLVDLNRVAQDGMRVRASAGTSSFRRRPSLEEALALAEAQVEALRVELDDDPGEVNRRQKGARQRAAEERRDRIKRALERLPELEAKKKAGEKDKARCSTTDPEATTMKMGDGGFRPAYNVQFATDTATQVIVGVEVVTVGTDADQMTPMVAQIQERYETTPGAYLVDGGFASHEQIEAMAEPQSGCTVYAPVPKPKVSAVDRHEPKPGDRPAVAAWRVRMATPEAKAIYKERASTAECVNALARNRGLVLLRVRGLLKVKAIALWHALSHTMLRAATLRAGAAGSA